MSDPTYFVWLRVNGKFEPQKMRGLPINSATGKSVYSSDVLVFSRLLDDWERDMSLSALCQKYPYETKGEI